MSVITISREFGAGGKTMGKCIADKLGYHFVDEEVIERLEIGQHTISSVPRRMKRLGEDPLAPVLELESDLLGALERLTSRFGQVPPANRPG